MRKVCNVRLETCMTLETVSRVDNEDHDVGSCFGVFVLVGQGLGGGQRCG